MAQIKTGTLLVLALATLCQGIPFDLGHMLIQPQNDGAYRLANNTHPISYKVHLVTNIHLENITDVEKFIFRGSVEIKLKADQVTDFIQIHARQLKVSNEKLVDISDEEETPIELEPIDVDVEHDFLKFTLANGVNLDVAKEYLLSMDYEGTLRTDNQGFYRSFYVDKNRKEVWLATTQLESTDSRHAFPCYDEPNIRTTFTFTIDCGLPYYAVSNMPIASRTER